MRNGHRLTRPFLDISGLVSFEGERGLLSVAFPPDYATSGSFYVYYTDKQGNIRIDEFKRRSPTRAARGSRRAVIEIPHPVNANHNGGQMQFLGNLLYFGTGDGGAAGDPPNNAQNTDSLLGKILRIDPRPSGGRPYTVPASNPFVGKPGRDEIYSYGLRNPFRFSFDTVSASSRGSRSATSARTSSRRSTTRRSPPRPAPTSAGTPSRASPPTAKKAAAPPTRAARSNRSSPTPTAVAAVRSSGATSSPTIRCRASTNATSTPTTATASCAASSPTCRASGDRKLGLSVEEPSSFGIDDRGHLYVASLTGPVYRLVAR